MSTVVRGSFIGWLKGKPFSVSAERGGKGRATVLLMYIFEKACCIRFGHAILAFSYCLPLETICFAIFERNHFRVIVKLFRDSLN